MCYLSFFIKECHCLTCNLLRSFIHIAVCEGSFSEPRELENIHNISLPAATIPEASIEDFNSPNFRGGFSSEKFS